MSLFLYLPGISVVDIVGRVLAKGSGGRGGGGVRKNIKVGYGHKGGVVYRKGGG